MQRRKILTRAHKEGVIDLVEKLIPSGLVQRFHRFAENSFYSYAKATCALCLVPLVFSDGKIQKASPKRLLLHYAVLSLVAMNMSQKLFITVQRLGAGHLDILTYLCFAAFLTQLVTFCNSASNVLLPDETMDIINGWPKILPLMCDPDEASRDKMRIIVNTKTALVISAQAVMAPVIAVGVSGASFLFESEPLSLYSMVQAIGLIAPDSRVPRLMWKLLLWPFEFATYLVPLVSAVWGAQVLVLVFVIVLSCVDNLR